MRRKRSKSYEKEKLREGKRQGLLFKGKGSRGKDYYLRVKVIVSGRRAKKCCEKREIK